jgi:putative oxidoreductase
MEAAAELGSGVCLVLGLLTPCVTAMLIGDMLVAIFEVHASKGLWSQNGGFEYNLVLIAMLFCLGLIGPGIYSLDGRLPALPRPHTFAAALVISLLVVGVAVVPGHILTG